MRSPRSSAVSRLSRRRPALACAAAACALVVALAPGQPFANAQTASAGPCAIYCIPTTGSPLTFTHVAASAHCSIAVTYEVVTKGRVHLTLKGASRGDRHIDRSADPLVGSGSHTYKFKKLVAGAYKLRGFYEGDSGRAVSAGTALRCH